MRQEESPPPPPAATTRRPKLTTLPLIALLFFDVSGGPFGVEDSVGAAGPLLAILGFLLLPFLWSLPEALVTAELSALFPSNGSYIRWVSAAFAPFWGLQLGVWKLVSGVLDNALYPVLFLDYLQHSAPLFAAASPARPLALLLLTAALTFLNYRGLHIVGLSAVFLAAFSLSPFVALSVLAVPRIRPARWLAGGARGADWRVYLNSLFWNLNYWDKAGAVAGEVEEPGRVFPRAVFGAVGLVVAGYVVPLLAGTGAVEGGRGGEWRDGFFALVGREVGGEWLGWWMQAAAAVANVGLFEAEMSSDSYQLLGMSEMGMIPQVFSIRF